VAAPVPFDIVVVCVVLLPPTRWAHALGPRMAGAERGHHTGVTDYTTTTSRDTRPVFILERVMTPVALARWHEVVRERDVRLLDAVLADSVVFHSPVVHTPQAGKPVTMMYLGAALKVFFNESFRYVREVVGEHDAMLEFEVQIDGVHVNGVDMLRWNDDGRIVDFKVMLRPLKAVNLIHQKMGEMLQRMQAAA
jgi:hypothetical protein